MNPAIIPQDTLKKQPDIVFFAAIEMGTYLLIVCCSCSFSLSFIFLFFFSPTKSKGLENSAREYTSLASARLKKKRKREKRKRREHWLFFCSGKNRVCYVWDEIIRINDSMDATLLYLI